MLLAENIDTAAEPWLLRQRLSLQLPAGPRT